MSQKKQDNHKKPRLIVVEKFDQVKEKHIVNKGKGAGGANTNKNGLPYEEMTELKTHYSVLKSDKNLNEITFKEHNEKKYILLYKGQLFRYMNNKMSHEFSKAHGCKQPDECFIDEESKYIFIIEKKFQQTSGSVCEKIGTPHSKIWHYSRTFPDYKIIYIYCLSDWFKVNCKCEIDYLAFHNYPYFWGNSETYKEDIIDFITNYK